MVIHILSRWTDLKKRIKMKELTIREKAAIALYLCFDDVSPRDMLRVARDATLAETNALKDLPASASRWFHSERIQTYLRGQELLRDEKQAKERRAIEAEILSKINATNPGTKIGGDIDYSNPRNREQLYNEIIDKSKNDPRTQLDAAKMFEQIQKDNREAASTHQKHVRYYLPLRCESCVLYRKAKEAREKQVK